MINIYSKIEEMLSYFDDFNLIRCQVVHHGLSEVDYRLFILKLHKWIRIRKLTGKNKSLKLNGKDVEICQVMCEKISNVSSILICNQNEITFSTNLSDEEILKIEELILEKVDVKLRIRRF